VIALDLYSGTGAATAAFRKAAEWSVVAVDLDLAGRPDVVADVRRLPISGGVDFLWASPPCTEFSDANPENRRPIAGRPSLECVFATLQAVRDLRPRFWILENVRGAIPFLGIPVQKIGPWCLWGYFPPIRVSVELASWRKSRFHTAAARGRVPDILSEAVFRSVSRFWDFPRILDMREMRRHRHVAAGPAAPLLRELLEEELVP
jgi:hypothetical protein